MNKIHYFKEKKWIMAWWFKKNVDFTESEMMYQWRQWWKDDFGSIDDQRFQDAFAWVKETIATKTKEEIQKGRYDIANYKPVPKYLQELAVSQGFYIKKNNVKKKPLSVTGYAVYKNNSKKAVYGEKFDLTVKQIIEFLENKR